MSLVPKNRLRVLTADVVNEKLTGSYNLAVLKAFTQTLSRNGIRELLEMLVMSLNREALFVSWHTF